MIPILFEAIREPLARAGIRWTPDVERCFVYNNFGPRASAVLVFAYPPGGRDPGLVVKISRAAALIDAEHASLERLKPRLGHVVPTPYACGRLGGDAYLAMEALPGRPPASGSVPPREAVDALCAIHPRVRTGEPLPAGDLVSLVPDGVPTGEGSEASWTETTRRGVRRYRVEALEPIAASPPERIPQHGDFVPSNLLVRRGSLVGVVDWEHYGRSAVPFYDLVWLFLSSALGSGASLVSELAGGGEVLDAMASAVRRYAEALELDPALAPALLPGLTARIHAHNVEDGRSLAPALRNEVEALFAHEDPTRHPAVLRLRERIG